MQTKPTTAVLGNTLTYALIAVTMAFTARAAQNDTKLAVELRFNSLDDFEPEDGPADERPWVAQRLRDMQNRPWLRLNVRGLLTHPGFMDAGLEPL